MLTDWKQEITFKWSLIISDVRQQYSEMYIK